MSTVPEVKSWAAEVLPNGERAYVRNALRFATRDEAEEYSVDLYFRWAGMECARVAPTSEPVNATWAADRVVRL